MHQMCAGSGFRGNVASGAKSLARIGKIVENRRNLARSWEVLGGEGSRLRARAFQGKAFEGFGFRANVASEAKVFQRAGEHQASEPEL